MISVLRMPRTSPASWFWNSLAISITGYNEWNEHLCSCVSTQWSLHGQDSPPERHSQVKGRPSSPDCQFISRPSSWQCLRAPASSGQDWTGPPLHSGFCVHVSIEPEQTPFVFQDAHLLLSLINVQNTPHSRVMGPPVQTSVSVFSPPIVHPLLLIIAYSILPQRAQNFVEPNLFVFCFMALGSASCVAGSPTCDFTKWSHDL